QATQTREIVQSVDRLLLSLVDAETGQRGFLLTGENRYLEPYTQATQTIPVEVAKLRSLVASQPSELANVERLNRLVDQKLSELGETISLRKTQGVAPALDLVLSDQGRKTMDEIRGVCTEIQRTQNLNETKASTDGEAAARTALLATVIGALVMLSFFAFGLEPITLRDPQVKKRPWPLVYGAAVLATIAAISLRLALTPVIGTESMRYTLLFLAVLFSAWYGGFRAGVLSILLSALAVDYYFVPPMHTFGLIDPRDQIDLLI